MTGGEQMKADSLCHQDGCLNDAVPFDYFCARHTSIGPNPSTQPADFVPHVEAKEIAQRFINRHFGNADKEFPRISIPADARHDDDLRLMAYIGQCIDTAARLREVEEERDALKVNYADAVDMLIKAEAQRDGLLRAAKNIMHYHGAYIDALPGERGLCDLEALRNAIANAEAG